MNTKINPILFVSMLAMGLTFFSCSDDEIGSQGEQGEQGETGIAGANGSVIYSGDDTPNDAIGVSGDYYLDRLTSNLYGPKMEDGNWESVESFSLIGSSGTDGQDGTDGNEILSGNGAPDLAIGELGDFYLDIETSTLYGPKIELDGLSSSWGVGLLLKGTDGNANVKSFVFTVNTADWAVYSNTNTSTTKTIIEDIRFSAIDEDLYENGIILVYWKDANALKLLPSTSLTGQNNFLTREGYVFENMSDGAYILRLKNILKGIQNTTELLSVEDTEYSIKLITGQAAENLQIAAPNASPETLLKTAQSLGFLD